MPYTWSSEQQRYLYPSGNPVAWRQIDGALDRVIQQSAQNITVMTEKLQTGAITLANWQQQMAQEMKMMHVGAAAMGNGGWANMTQSDWGWVGSRLRSEYGYLRNFAHDIATGDQPLDGRLLNRATMYAAAARGTQREIQRRIAILNGALEERNLLGPAEHHCDQCPSLTSLGWVMIGTLPSVGARTCLSRCKCRIETRK